MSQVHGAEHGERCRGQHKGAALNGGRHRRGKELPWPWSYHQNVQCVSGTSASSRVRTVRQANAMPHVVREGLSRVASDERLAEGVSLRARAQCMSPVECVLSGATAGCGLMIVSVRLQRVQRSQELRPAPRNGRYVASGGSAGQIKGDRRVWLAEWAAGWTYRYVRCAAGEGRGARRASRLGESARS